MWFYDTGIKSVGIIYIKQLSINSFGTYINNNLCERCDNPEASANNVYMHFTGCNSWDSLNGQISNVPRDLSEWEKS